MTDFFKTKNSMPQYGDDSHDSINIFIISDFSHLDFGG